MSLASAKGGTLSEQDRAFLQHRVALFGLFSGGGYLFFWCYRIVASVVVGHLEEFTYPSFWWHFVAATAFLSLWLINRAGSHSARFVRTSELVALSVGVLATGAMAIHIRFADRPDFIILLALYNVVIGRAIFVPSTGRWTFTLGVVIGAILVACVFVVSLRLDIPKWSALYPEIAGQRPEIVAADIAVDTLIWWVLAIMMSTGASVVIYGLRLQVREAEQLGQYRLEEKLGEGGMGVVYRASHALLRRPTAVKLLPPDKAGADNLRRFEQEVQLTASLTHPHTITIFDYGHTSDGVFYYAMEYVDGLSLTDIVARSGAQHQGRVVELVRQAAAALVEAHGIGLVHRDIKPSNIMVQLLHRQGGGGDFVKVLDFGLVKEVRQEGGIDLTNDANIAGTPQYMAPEAIADPESVDARADLYALGAVAYYLLTGTHVFGGRNIVEVSSHHLHTVPDPPSARLGAPIDSTLEAIVLRCLAKDPADRCQSAFELECALRSCARASSWTAQDAQDWWRSHGPSTVTSSDQPSAGTIAVEWGASDRADPDRG